MNWLDNLISNNYAPEILFLAPCRNLRGPLNGFIQTSSGNKLGGIITFKCEQGYTIQGPTAVECNNGSWNDSLPICRRK